MPDEISSGVTTVRGPRIVGAGRAVILPLLVLCAIITISPATFAQGVTVNPGGGGAPEPSAIKSYPPLPPGQPFFRGYPPASGMPSVTGFYLSLFKLAIALGTFFIWVAASHWAHQDSEYLKVRHSFWPTVLLVSGLTGFLCMFVIPTFWAAGPLMLAAVFVPLGVYVKERNERVPESGKVMTPEHIKRVTLRVLAQMGINVGGETIETAGPGPNIKFIGKSDTGEEAGRVQSSRGYLAAKELVYDAILRRATDIHLEPKDEQIAVRVRIDGVMYPSDPFEKRTGEACVNIFKVLGAMDITEKRRPQDGSFRAIMDSREIDFRAATQGTRFGEKISLRILDQSNSVSTMKGLGFRKSLLEQMSEIVDLPHGMFIVCGPTGAGKSTTLYACLNTIDSTQKNIITVEDPVEYKMSNINQIEINTRSGQTFAKSLRSMLRQDPDVVMIGEIRDGETAGIACQAANTGHLVFSTIHANDSITALYRFLELDVEPFMVANSISAILAQRLARRLCPDCKEPYRPDPDLLKKLGLPKEKVTKFYRPPKDSQETCGSCGGLGYKGRVGVFELFPVNDRIRELIRTKSGMDEIKSEARKNGMLYMKEEGLRLVVRGVTSYDELVRVVK